MTDKNNEEKTPGVSYKKTLTLKRSGVEHTTVKQNFSHGRTKAVVVETRRRKISRLDEKKEQHVVRPIARPHIAPRPKQNRESPPPKAAPRVSNLSSTEMEARLRALKEARIRAEEERLQMEDARRRLEEEEALKKERERILQEKEENSRLKKKNEDKSESELKNIKQSIDAEKQSSDVPSEKVRFSVHNGKRRTRDEDEEDRVVGARRAARALVRQKSIRGGEERRRVNKLRVSSALDENIDVREHSMAATRRRQEKFKRLQPQEPREKISREVIIPETMTIQELAQRMAERSVDVIRFLMNQGQMLKPGDVIDGDMAQLIAEDFSHTVKRVSESDVEVGIFNIADDKNKMRHRPPVITIMGHVDHGKTSLLDAIRKANVVSAEAGGITQHIGAYQVVHNGQKLTFIDTPGHAAFTAMRARGAQATDIAVLVVAADDSVMPQTIESINHAKAANVPIIVAINKIDRVDSDSQRVRNELSHHSVFVEKMGGSVLEVEVSAKTGKNLDKLLEAILLQAEILELKADPDRTVEGVVIEAKLDRGRGSVATVLVQKGTLRPGDIIVAGDEWGRVRALINERGAYVKEATPSTPVEILGLQGPPQAGDRFAAVLNEAQARGISEYRKWRAHEKSVARQAGSRGSLEQMMNQLQSYQMKEFFLVVKGDVQGSIEAIKLALKNLGNDEVQVSIVHAGVGGITETDVSLAIAAKAMILGFNVRANNLARDAAIHQSIDIRYYNVIYNLVDDIRLALSGMLSPELRETFIGNAEIREVFHISKIGRVSGCRVIEGKVERGMSIRIIRDNVVIHQGRLKTLKRFKEEVEEVFVGQECGMAFENYDDIQAHDIIEVFRIEHVSRSL
ncbi:MAG: translation initiation factor IF-2 [Candidatus Tokpelaia sp. JSC161]|jgi:translation initiation factor IF-2|nr:MAG: translation initiation factor IF-2 [Candidatus Tokpelaia sp. JSC161]